jgi:hypothetical protein
MAEINPLPDLGQKVERLKLRADTADATLRDPRDLCNKLFRITEIQRRLIE